jgi:hypothetical protein
MAVVLVLLVKMLIGHTKQFVDSWCKWPVSRFIDVVCPQRETGEIMYWCILKLVWFVCFVSVMFGWILEVKMETNLGVVFTEFTVKTFLLATLVSNITTKPTTTLQQTAKKLQKGINNKKKRPTWANLRRQNNNNNTTSVWFVLSIVIACFIIVK